MDLSIDINPASATYRDLVLVAGDLALTSDVNPAGTHYILQNILQRLSMFRGEWFLNKTIGVPYFQQILVKSPNKAVVDRIFQDTVLSTPGVRAMLSYTSAFKYGASRLLTIAFRADTVAGIVSYSGPLNTPNDMVVLS